MVGVRSMGANFLCVGEVVRPFSDDDPASVVPHSAFSCPRGVAKFYSMFPSLVAFEDVVGARSLAAFVGVFYFCTSQGARFFVENVCALGVLA